MPIWSTGDDEISRRRRTWSWPRVLLDSVTDDRDADILETAKGTLLASVFTSIAYQDHLNDPDKLLAKRFGPQLDEHLAKWKQAESRSAQEQKEADVGMWFLRSEDGGVTWSERLPAPANSPHGPIQLADGRLLYAGKELWTKEKKVGVDGYPSHLLQLKDNTLLMTYGFRKEPFGIRGKTSSDNGQTWSEEFRITAAAATWDLGYPSTVQNADGNLVTVWYEVLPDSPQAVFRQARWRLK